MRRTRQAPEVLSPSSRSPSTWSDLSGWSISKSVFDLIAKIVPENGTILELGSGEASPLLAQYFSTVYSVENDKRWLGRFDGPVYLEVPLVPVTYEQFPLDKHWYDPDILERKLSTIDEYDLILVDGPTGFRGGFYMHFNLFDETVPIILDDVHEDKHASLLEKICTKYTREYEIFTESVRTPSGKNKKYALIR
jgi:hypothetical protein